MTSVQVCPSCVADTPLPCLHCFRTGVTSPAEVSSRPLLQSAVATSSSPATKFGARRLDLSAWRARSCAAFAAGGRKKSCTDLAKGSVGLSDLGVLKSCTMLVDHDRPPSLPFLIHTLLSVAADALFVAVVTL